MTVRGEQKIAELNLFYQSENYKWSAIYFVPVATALIASHYSRHHERSVFTSFARRVKKIAAHYAEGCILLSKQSDLLKIAF